MVAVLEGGDAVAADDGRAEELPQRTLETRVGRAVVQFDLVTDFPSRKE